MMRNGDTVSKMRDCHTFAATGMMKMIRDMQLWQLLKTICTHLTPFNGSELENW